MFVKVLLEGFFHNWRKNIASYKWPKILDFTKELPKTISGKIRRKEIKENDWNEDENNE